MASTDGSTSSDPTGKPVPRVRRRARTAAEQREAAAQPNDPEVLAAEIERTREELAETLDAIADKVSPKRVADRTKKKVGHAVREGAEGAAATVKAGAGHLKEAVHDKKEAVRGAKDAGDSAAAGSGEGLTEALASVGEDPGPDSSFTAAGTQTVARPVTPPDLRPVSSSAGADASSARVGPAALAGAVAALAVALLVLRRRRGRRSRWS